MSQRVTVITELPADELATGVRRRLEHYLPVLAAAGDVVTHVSLFDGPPVALRRTISRARAIDVTGLAAPGGRVVVIGLGDVGLMMVADSLARSGCAVTFDQCDSMVLQLRASIKTARVKDAIWGLFRIRTRRRISARIRFTYISGRDRRWDALANVRRGTGVVPPNVDPRLLELGEVSAQAITRVSIPADFASPHLSRGLGMLWEAVRDRTPVPLDLFGPAAPDVALPPNARYRGFAAEIGELYEGDTAVFIANVGGAGVPNKLLEAASAGRPVIVHPSVRRRVDVEVNGWTFRTSGDIARVLEAIAHGSSPRVL